MTTKLQQFCIDILPVIQAGAKGARISWDVDVGSAPIELNANADYLTFESDRKYQVMRDMIEVNGFKVPAGEKIEPESGANCFYPKVESYYLYDSSGYYPNATTNKRLLDAGLIYLNKEDAIARAKAMLGIDPYAEEKADDTGDMPE